MHGIGSWNERLDFRPVYIHLVKRFRRLRSLKDFGMFELRLRVDILVLIFRDHVALFESTLEVIGGSSWLSF